MINNIILDNLEVIMLGASPLIIYGIFKFKNCSYKKNNLTRFHLQLKKQQEAISNKSKSSLF